MKSSILKKMIPTIVAICICIIPSLSMSIEPDSLLDEFFASHGSVMLIIDADSGAIIDANRAAVDFYGYTRKELTSMHIQDINTLSVEETEAERRKAFTESRNYFLFDHRLSSGEIRNVEVYSYPIESDGQNRLYSIIHDITEKTMLEQTLESRNRTYMFLGIILIAIQMAVIFLLLSSRMENESIKKELISSKEKYQSLFDNIQEGFALHEIITDGNGVPIDYRFIDVNNAFEETTGLADVEGKTMLELLPETEELWINRYGKVALTGESIQFESFSQTIGKNYHVHAFSPKKNQFATIFFDITKRVEAENALEAEKDRLRTIILSVGEGFIATNERGQIESMNPVAEQMSGWNEEEVKGRLFKEVFEIADESDSGIEYTPIDDVLLTKMTIDRKRDAYLVTRDGGRIAIALTAAPIPGPKGVVQGVVMIFRDIGEENIYRRRIEYMSYHDHLTGLYNRRFLEEEISRLDTKRNLPLSVVYADVNGLKLINDAFGHEKGDRLISETARVLKECCRVDDIIARVGGDEFAILLPSTPSETAERLVDRIRSAVKEVRLDTGGISVALGWETKSVESQSMKEILRKSESHMYRRKLSESSQRRGEAINEIMETLFEKIEYERGHSRGVAFLCKEIGKAMNLTDYEIEELEMLGTIHDVGMVGIEDGVLNKSVPLTEDEWKEIKRHPEIGRRILASSVKFTDLSKYVVAHHERWDGTGHPKGLKGKEIPLYSRILGIADAYEAMTNERCYKKKLSKEEAMEEIRRNAGIQFDPRIAKTFLDYLEQQAPGTSGFEK